MHCTLHQPSNHLERVKTRTTTTPEPSSAEKPWIHWDHAFTELKKENLSSILKIMKLNKDRRINTKYPMEIQAFTLSHETLPFHTIILSWAVVLLIKGSFSPMMVHIPRQCCNSTMEHQHLCGIRCPTWKLNHQPDVQQIFRRELVHIYFFHLSSCISTHNSLNVCRCACQQSHENTKHFA